MADARRATTGQLFELAVAAARQEGRGLPWRIEATETSLAADSLHVAFVVTLKGKVYGRVVRIDHAMVDDQHRIYSEVRLAARTLERVLEEVANG
jgi:hypothetical protein